MNTEHDTLESMLEAATPVLSAREQETMWNSIANNLAVPAPVVSSFSSFFRNTRIQIAAIMALFVMLTSSGTVYAAQMSRPGDFFFPVKRTIENTRIALAPNEMARATLIARYADVRVAELRNIISEEATDISSEKSHPSSITNETPLMLQASNTESSAQTISRSFKVRGEMKIGRAVDAVLAYMNDTHMKTPERERVLKAMFSTIDPFSLAVEAEQSDTEHATSTEGSTRVHVERSSTGVSHLEIRMGRERTNVEKRGDTIEVHTTRAQNQEFQEQEKKDTHTSTTSIEHASSTESVLREFSTTPERVKEQKKSDDEMVRNREKDRGDDGRRTEFESDDR